MYMQSTFPTRGSSRSTIRHEHRATPATPGDTSGEHAAVATPIVRGSNASPLPAGKTGVSAKRSSST